jgi:O-Antigen ligase
MSARAESAPRRGSGSPQVTGVVLAAASIAWTFLAAGRSGGSGTAWALTLVGCVATFAVARSLAGAGPAVVPGLIVGAAGVLLAASYPALVSGTGSGPFGYSNADAAFFTQAMVAACMLGCAWKRPVPRTAAFGTAAVFAAVPIAGGARAVAVLCLLPVAALVAGRWKASTRAFVTICMGLFVVAFSSTVLLGTTYQPDGSSGIDEVVDSTIGERRVELWHDAVVLMGDHPLTGVGPGRWAEESPVAHTDPDLGWAHNAFLEQGAETGVMGMTLLIVIVLWGFVYLGAHPDGGAFVALGAAALTAFGLHASIDYILAFPAVAMATAALVGAAGSALRAEVNE